MIPQSKAAFFLYEFFLIKKEINFLLNSVMFHLHTLYDDKGEALNIFIAMTAVTIELTYIRKKSRRWMCEVMLTRDVSNHWNFKEQKEDSDDYIIT